MTILQTGSTNKYAENWATAFGGKSKNKPAATARNGAGSGARKSAGKKKRANRKQGSK